MSAVKWEWWKTKPSQAGCDENIQYKKWYTVVVLGSGEESFAM